MLTSTICPVGFVFYTHKSIVSTHGDAAYFLFVLPLSAGQWWAELREIGTLVSYLEGNVSRTSPTVCCLLHVCHYKPFWVCYYVFIFLFLMMKASFSDKTPSLERTRLCCLSLGNAGSCLPRIFLRLPHHCLPCYGWMVLETGPRASRMPECLCFHGVVILARFLYFI